MNIGSIIGVYNVGYSNEEPLLSTIYPQNGNLNQVT